MSSSLIRRVHLLTERRINTLKKLIKWLGIFTFVGAAVGIAAHFLISDSDNSDEEHSDFTEDDDFDLDADLKPASEREYFSLKKNSEETSENDSEGQTDVHSAAETGTENL